MKKCLIILITPILLACEQEESQVVEPEHDIWKPLEDFPGQGRSNGKTIAFSLLGKGYFGLGGNNDTRFLRDIWCYNPQQDSWEQKSDFPFDVPAQVSLSMNDKGYVMTYSGSLYEYDPNLDSWQHISIFPTGNRPGIAGFALRDNIYFGTGNNVGGDDFTVYNDFWKYRPTDNSWTQLTDFPGVARTGAKSFVIEDTAYVGLGFNGEGAPPFYTDMWKYNADLDTWTQIADFPSSDISGIIFSSATKGYVGVNDEKTFNYCRVYEFNPEMNTWAEVQRFPSSSFLHTESFTINDQLFVLGGWWSDYSNQIWEYIP